MLSVGTELPVGTFSDSFLWNERLRCLGVCWVFFLNNGKHIFIFLTKSSSRFLQVYQLDINLNSELQEDMDSPLPLNFIWSLFYCIDRLSKQRSYSTPGFQKCIPIKRR